MDLTSTSCTHLEVMAVQFGRKREWSSIATESASAMSCVSPLYQS